jgi:CRISPR-associated protein Csx16
MVSEFESRLSGSRMNFLITRHVGAQEWLRKQISEPTVYLDHLAQIDVILPGDTVIGTLPINLIDAVCRRGGRYLHLVIDLPNELRGKELSAQQLIELNAELVEYFTGKSCSGDAIVPFQDELERK